MEEIFNKEILEETSKNIIKQYPARSRVSSLMSNNYNLIYSYYSNSGRYVKRPNKLVTLLTILDIDFSDTPENVFDYLKVSSSYAANTIGFINTTNRNTDPIFSTAFKNNDVNEYYLVANESLMPDSNYFNLLNGFKCLATNLTDVFLTHPYEYEFGSNLDYVIFSIDIPAIGLAFYYWVRRQQELDNDTDPARFVYTELLTNVIKDLLELTSINRFIKMFKFQDKLNLYNDNPFYLNDITNYVKKYYKYQIDVLKKSTSIYWRDAILNFPLLLNNNILYFLKLPNIPTNKRNEWILWLARLPIINFLIKNFDKRLNRHIIKSLDIKLSFLDHSRYLEVENNITEMFLESELNILKKQIKRS